ncbi:MAG: S8 family serine peptidase, partial [Nonomuraea sp.]|nr:S8 family serine peptidase [Nonomuraea sp.]
MRLRPLIACSVLLAMLMPAVPALADGPAPPPTGEKLEEGLAVDTGTVRAIVELASPAENAPVAAQATAQQLDVVLKPDSQPFVVVQGTAQELEALAKDPRVTSIHRDRAYPPTAVPGLQLIGADKAHEKGYNGNGQVVAVLDTGIDTDHPYLQGRVVGEACFSATGEGAVSLCQDGKESQIGDRAADAANPQCTADGVNMCEHGTHVAGIVAGSGGVAPGAQIYAIQVFSRVNDEDVCGEPSCILAFESSLRLALDYVGQIAGALPIVAVNMSLGGALSETACDGTEEGQVLKPKIDALLAKGVATVVAAGNESFEGASYPGCISSAVTVGAGTGDDTIADFSNRGGLVDLFAPGVDIDSSVPDNQMAVHSGTSMAAPHVAGALALLKAASPQTPTAELVEKLKASGRPYVYQANGAEVKTPRLDVMAALTGAAAQPPISQNPSAPASPEPTGSGPTPDPGPSDEPADPGDPSPIPLPTVTVTVTV